MGRDDYAYTIGNDKNVKIKLIFAYLGNIFSYFPRLLALAADKKALQ